MNFHTTKSANDYVLKHGILMPNKQVVLTEPLYVYKRIFADNYKNNRAIANLIIPVGAFVNLATGSDLKFRASEALCYSIIEKYSGKAVSVGYSGYTTNDFKYHSALRLGIKEPQIALAVHTNKVQGKDRFTQPSWKNSIAMPIDPFNGSTEECRSGIHFFLDQKRALAY